MSLHGLSWKPAIYFLVGLVSALVSVWAASTLYQAYRDALDKADPHHARMLARAKAQLGLYEPSKPARNDGKTETRQ